MRQYFKVCAVDENTITLSSLNENLVIKKESIERILQKNKRTYHYDDVELKDFNPSKEDINRRRLTYDFHNATVYIDADTTIWQNGREVKTSKLTTVDRFTLDLGLTTDYKLKKRFALFPTRLACGSRVWLKTFYTLYGSRWGSGLHSGSYYYGLCSFKTMKEAGEFYLGHMYK